MSEPTALAPLEASILATLVPSSPDAMLAPTSTDSAPPERRNALQAPYVAFRGKKSEARVEALNDLGINVSREGNGAFYLMDVTPIKLSDDGSARIHLIQYKRIFTIQDDSGKPTHASLDPGPNGFDDGYREALYGVVAVVLEPGKFVAATIQLRGPMVNALNDSIKLLGTAERPGAAMNPLTFAARGPAWAKAANASFPGGRFRTIIKSTLEAPKGPGQKFNQGHGVVVPTPEGEIEALNKWRIDAWPSIQMAMTVNNAKFERLRRLAMQQAADDLPTVGASADGE